MHEWDVSGASKLFTATDTAIYSMKFAYYSRFFISPAAPFDFTENKFGLGVKMRKLGGIFRPAGNNECPAEFYPALGLFVVRELAMYPAVFALNKL
jgi:hypothetical protein